MRLYEVCVLLALYVCACIVCSAEYTDRSEHRLGYNQYEKPVKYNFAWQSKDDYGNNFGHQESREQDKTSGSYFVHLPDGRLQKVTYYVDGDSGFQAQVSYEGQAKAYDSNVFKSKPSALPYSAQAEPVYKPNYQRPSYPTQQHTVKPHYPLKPDNEAQIRYTPEEKSYTRKPYPPSYDKTQPYYAGTAQPSYHGKYADPKDEYRTTESNKYPQVPTKKQYQVTDKTESEAYLPKANSNSNVQPSYHGKYADLKEEYRTTESNKYPQVPTKKQYQIIDKTESEEYIPKVYSNSNAQPSSTYRSSPNVNKGKVTTQRLSTSTQDGAYNGKPEHQVAKTVPARLAYPTKSYTDVEPVQEDYRTTKPYALAKLAEKKSTYVPAYQPKPVPTSSSQDSAEYEMYTTAQPLTRGNTAVRNDHYSSKATKSTESPPLYPQEPLYRETATFRSKSQPTYPKKTDSYSSEESEY